MSRELVTAKNSLHLKETEFKETLSVYEKKNAALLSDLRFMRDENQKLHDRVREANEAVLLLE